MTQATAYGTPNSVTALEELDGRPVFVKRHLANGWRQSPESLVRQTALETDVVRNLRELPVLERTDRLGTLRIVASDPREARIVMEVAPGRPLQELLLRPFKGRGGWRSVLQALHCAGRWLREFRHLGPPRGDHGSAFEPLPVYCGTRLRTLQSLGFEPLTDAVRDRCETWLERRLAACDPSEIVPRWGHGDFGPFNLLWDGYRLTPIDFSTCRPDYPLLDLSYLIHRLELLPIQFPWRSWPLESLCQAVFRGYGEGDLRDRPLWQALAFRHDLCRVQSLFRRPAAKLPRRLHNRWVRHHVWRRLLRRAAQP